MHSWKCGRCNTIVNYKTVAIHNTENHEDDILPAFKWAIPRVMRVRRSYG